MPDNCIFCKIGRSEIPVELIYQDDEFIAFHDLNPQAPVHALVIPKAHYETILEVSDAGVLGRGLMAVSETARLLKLDRSGFRTVINCRDDGGQTVYHLHFHVLGGRYMTWPPG